MPRAKPGAEPLTADGRKEVRFRWRLDEAERAKDEAAREYWADRTHEADVRRAGEERLEAAEAEAQGRLSTMQKDGVTFAYGSDARRRPASAAPRLPAQRGAARGAAVATELIELTPRGSEAVKCADPSFVSKLPNQVRGTSQHGLPSHSDCGATRSLSIKWP